MRRRSLIAGLGGTALAPLRHPSARAQDAASIRRIGFLRVGSPPPAWIAALRASLHALGWIEGRNLTIEFGLASGPDRLPEAIAELIRSKVDIILASGTPPVLAARDAAGATPVIFVAAIDPVATGLVASLARPGGNVTGLTSTQADITGKQFQLVKELLPELSRVAVMVRASSRANARYVQEAEIAARTLGLQLQILTVREPGDLDATFAAARGAQAIVIPDDTVFTGLRSQIAELALRSRLPLIYSTSEFVKAGGFMSYGPNNADLYRRAATYVDKILKGAKPADLPVEQPTRFELTINLKTAKALELALPPILLARADELIE